MADYASELSELMPETPQGTNTSGLGINVKRLIKLRSRAMIMAFLLIAVPACVAVWMIIPAKYVASSNLEFRAKIESLFNPNAARTETQRVYDNYVNTQINLMKSATTVNRFLEDEEKVASVPKLAAMPSGRLYYVLSNLEANQTKYSELVNVSFKDTDMDTAVKIVDLVIASYLDYQEEQALQRGGTNLQTLKANEKRFSEKLEALEQELKDMGEKYGVSVIDDQGGINLARVSPLREQSAIAQSELASNRVKWTTSKMQLERIQALVADYKKDPKAPIYAENVEQTIELDPTVQQLQIQVASSQQSYTMSKEKYVDDYRVVREKLQELNRVREQLLLERSKVRGSLIHGLADRFQREVDMAGSFVMEAEEKIANNNNLLEVERKENLLESNKILNVQKKQQEIELARKDKDRITKSINELTVEIEGPARVSATGLATSSGKPDQGDRVKLGLLSILGAFSFSLIFGVFLEFRDQNIRSEQDVAYVTDLPVLATIPHTKEDKLPKDVNVATVTADYPNSMTADQFRQVVARMIQWEHRGRRMQSLAVVSPQHNEGKSILASNLAIALAQSDRKVLLVDANSRNPVVERFFNLEPAEGLTDMLSGESLVQDPDRETYIENLYVVGPGIHNTDLIEKLASKEMSNFIRGAERLFDYVIIDTPAALLTSEAKMLAPMVSGILVSVGAGKSSFGVLRRCIRNMEESGGMILGVVVNGVRHVTGGYLRQNRDMYYSQSQDSGSAADVLTSSARMAEARTRGRNADEEI